LLGGGVVDVGDVAAVVFASAVVVVDDDDDDDGEVLLIAACSVLVDDVLLIADLALLIRRVRFFEPVAEGVVVECVKLALRPLGEQEGEVVANDDEAEAAAEFDSILFVSAVVIGIDGVVDSLSDEDEVEERAVAIDDIVAGLCCAPRLASVSIEVCD
jgi:hypothetical protein